MFPDDPLPIHYSKTTGHVTIESIVPEDKSSTIG